MDLKHRFRELLQTGRLELPFPGRGDTPSRYRALTDVARRDLPLARLMEAHTDATAILAECGRKPSPGALYGVWASEISGQPMKMQGCGSESYEIHGSKMFCTGGGIVDRALVTVLDPASGSEPRLIDLDLHAGAGSIRFDFSDWVTEAFAETRTATATFDGVLVSSNEFVGEPGWYLSRPGFWHGAVGPAACWAGGAMGLVDYAARQLRNDPHVMAHLGAMRANVWLMESCLLVAGREIDENSDDAELALISALTVRHLVEQSCSDVLRRFGRAHGPRPLAFDQAMLRRYQEVELYIRQCHSEHDLEILGRRARRDS